MCIYKPYKPRGWIYNVQKNNNNIIFIGRVSKNVMPVVADDILIENYNIDAANRTQLRTITPSNFVSQGSRTRTFIIASTLRYIYL